MEQLPKANSLKRKRRIFGWVFLASFLVFMASNAVWTLLPSKENISDNCSENGSSNPLNCGKNNQNVQPQNPPTDPSSPSSFNLESAVYVSVVSLLTSLTSLIGFFSTTVLAWRKEKREIFTSEIELQKKELELEKLRMEIAKSSKESGDDGA